MDIAILIFGSLAAQAEQEPLQPLPTVGEVLAAYEQNRSLPSTLRVRWLRLHRLSDYFKEDAAVSAGFAEADLRAAKTPEERNSAKAQLELHRRMSTATDEQMTTTLPQDVWCNRDNFQLRVPRTTEMRAFVQAGAHGFFSFPDMEASGESLLTDFASIYVLSQGTQTQHASRVWMGHGQASGLVTRPGKTADYGILLSLPPLATADGSWSAQLHPVDAFFSGESREYQILGECEAEGIACLLVERNQGTGRHAYAVRAFLDPERAFLPLRLEYFPGGIADEFRDHIAPGYPDKAPAFARVVTEIEITEPVPGYFYPSRGIDRQYGARPRRPGDTRPSFVPQRETEWQVERVEVDRPMSDEMFALEFPEGTVFIDEATHQAMVVGNAEDHVRRLVIGENEPRPPARSARWVWGLVLAIVSALLLICIALARRRSERS